LFRNINNLLGVLQFVDIILM